MDTVELNFEFLQGLLASAQQGLCWTFPVYPGGAPLISKIMKSLQFEVVPAETWPNGAWD